MIIDAGVLPKLLSLAANGPYQSACMRRESARLLANMSERLAVRIREVLGEQSIQSWMTSVGNLRDPTVRVHAIRAKSSLSMVVA